MKFNRSLRRLTSGAASFSDRYLISTGGLGYSLDGAQPMADLFKADFPGLSTIHASVGRIGWSANGMKALTDVVREISGSSGPRLSLEIE